MNIKKLIAVVCSAVLFVSNVASVSAASLKDIFDAKYYTPVLSLGKKPQGQPGIESVTKQYLYQQAYRQFIIDHGLKQVKNSFLMPTEKNVVENMGSVRMNMFASMGLQDINVRYIHASRAYELYLSGNKFDINDLQL